MSTLVIVDLTPTDTEKLSAYSAKAAETLKTYGGEGDRLAHFRALR